MTGGAVCAQLDDTDLDRLTRYCETTRMTVSEAITTIAKVHLHRWAEAVEGHDVEPIHFPEKRDAI